MISNAAEVWLGAGGRVSAGSGAEANTEAMGTGSGAPGEERPSVRLCGSRSKAVESLTV